MIQPLEANWIDAFSVAEGATAPGQSESATFNPVSWDYFQTIGARAVSGRSFTAQDDQAPTRVLSSSMKALRGYTFPMKTALGQRLQLGAPARIWNNERLTTFEIVGIVGDVKSRRTQCGCRTNLLRTCQPGAVAEHDGVWG